MNISKSKYSLLNCLNCTIDLSEEITCLEHNPDDLLTKTANAHYDPAARCDRWEKFVDEIMCEDKELSIYLQKALGYAMSGDTSTECLFIICGRKTRNGKGTCMEAVSKIMGGYGKSLSPASLAQRSGTGDRPSPEFARVVGVRLVNVSEPDKGMVLNVGLAKRLTGGDSIIARYLHRNPIEFRPQFKIYINSNHYMEIEDDTIFTSGRIKMIPFDRHFDETERDNTLKDTFKKPENASGIFNWLLDGYRLFEKEGLTPPPKAVEALTMYRKECDTVGLFMETALNKCDEKIHVKTSVLYDVYKSWSTDFDIEPKSQKDFVATLRDKGLVDRHRNDGHIIKGYKLKEDNDLQSSGR